jgi:hypothetical protein
MHARLVVGARLSSDGFVHLFAERHRNLRQVLVLFLLIDVIAAE